MLEIHRSRVDKKNYLVDLYKNPLPTLILRTVREWTSGHYTLVAIEVNSTNKGCKAICVSSNKEWAIRVIRDEKGTLTYDELIDFINTTNYRT